MLDAKIPCKYCQLKTEDIHQNRPILVRDLSICNYFINKTTSGVTEGINNKIKLIIRQSYGFKTNEFFT